MRYSSKDLRHFVELQKPKVDRDSMGGVTMTYEKGGETWAGVKPLTARELLNADKSQAEITHRVVIRFETAPPIQTNWRIVFDNRTLEVATPPVDVDGRHQWLQLNCKERTDV